MFSMSSTPIDRAALLSKLEDVSAGACVTFEGWVRDLNDGNEVKSLEYEGYELMAVKEGAKVIEDAREKFDIATACCVHRVGHLQLGDMAVWVGVTAGHRGAAFDACRYIIDEIKHRLPIWKKEHYVSGDSGWINCEVTASHGE